MKKFFLPVATLAIALFTQSPANAQALLFKGTTSDGKQFIGFTSTSSNGTCLKIGNTFLEGFRNDYADTMFFRSYLINRGGKITFHKELLSLTVEKASAHPDRDNTLTESEYNDLTDGCEALRKWGDAHSN